MIATIHFYNEACWKAYVIDNESSNNMLAAERFSQLRFLQVSPQYSFGLGWILLVLSGIFFSLPYSKGSAVSYVVLIEPVTPPWGRSGGG